MPLLCTFPPRDMREIPHVGLSARRPLCGQHPVGCLRARPPGAGARLRARPPCAPA